MRLLYHGHDRDVFVMALVVEWAHFCSTGISWENG